MVAVEIFVALLLHTNSAHALPIDGRSSIRVIESSLAPVFAHHDRKGRLSEGADLFGPMLAVAGAGTATRRPPALGPKLCHTSRILLAVCARWLISLSAAELGTIYCAVGTASR